VLDSAKYVALKRSAGCTRTGRLRHVVKAPSPNAAHERTDESKVTRRLLPLLAFSAVISALAFNPCWLVDSALAQAPSLELVQTIPLPDVHGRIDHLDIDLEGERLFVAALANDSVEVIDLRSGQRRARLKEQQEPQGVAYLPQSKQLLVANGRGGRVDLFDGADLTPVGHIDRLDDADNVRYDAKRGLAYVGYGSALAVIDPAHANLVSRIQLPGHPESFQLETAGSRIYVNVPTAGKIAVVDRRNAAVLTTWSLGEMRANFPMALDERQHRLFVATRRPAALLVFDTGTGKLITKLSIDGDADDLFFDVERKRIYTICGEGSVDVVRQRDAEHYDIVDKVATAAGARTGLFSAPRKTLYVAIPARGSVAGEIRVYAPR
jgi:DNA-binding beta-propeller fold protein YncE